MSSLSNQSWGQLCSWTLIMDPCVCVGLISTGIEVLTSILVRFTCVCTWYTFAFFCGWCDNIYYVVCTVICCVDLGAQADAFGWRDQKVEAINHFRFATLEHNVILEVFNAICMFFQLWISLLMTHSGNFGSHTQSKRWVWETIGDYPLLLPILIAYKTIKKRTSECLWVTCAFRWLCQGNVQGVHWSRNGDLNDSPCAANG